MKIVHLDKTHIRDICEIHASTLRGDFLPSLGKNFLDLLYKNLLKSDLFFSYIAIEDLDVCGFIAGSENSKLLFRGVIRKNFFNFFYVLILKIVSCPPVLLRIFQTFLYSKKTDKNGITGELIIIAVAEKSQNKGLGNLLLSEFERHLYLKKIRKYKVTVIENNIQAKSFYEKHGFIKISRFNLYKKNWELYTKTFPDS